MRLLSAQQMRALDRRVIDDLGIPSLDLMERAGQAVADVAHTILHDPSSSILILCGKGNNGGDGLVAARLLQKEGHSVKVALPFSPDSLSTDARVMYDHAVKADVLIADSASDKEISSAGVVIDALLGTGISGPVTGVMGEWIERLNSLRAGRGVLAVDIPSGVDADNGKIYGPAVRAQATVTMALPKPGLVLYPGAELAGKWKVADIGFPPEVVAEWPCVGELVEAQHVAEWLPKRPPVAHKSSVGWALIVAGSFGMTGAAAMASTAAYRSGAGLVRLALPATLVPALNAALPEVVFRPMPATRAGTLSFRAVSRLLTEANEVQAALIGPGLSRNAATANAARRLIARWPGPLVVDADALTAMAGHDSLWNERQSPTIITPHPGEMSRLLGRSVPELEKNRLETAREAAARFNAITIYKGAPTVIAAPDGRVFVNSTGNAGLAVAGTGDVLAGMVTAWLAQGAEALHAAVLATFLGGLAADRLAARLGMQGMTALDLIEEIPHAIRDLSTIRDAAVER